MSNLQIRTAAKHDVETVISLINALSLYEKRKELDAGVRTRLLRDGFDEPRRFTTLLAELDGTAVGYALFFETYSSFLAKPILYLEDLLVLPETRSHGVGVALFKACAAEGLARGCCRMEWTVLDWNQLAIDFYRKIGAEQVNDRLLYRMSSEEMKPFVAATALKP